MHCTAPRMWRSVRVNVGDETVAVDVRFTWDGFCVAGKPATPLVGMAEYAAYGSGPPCNEIESVCKKWLDDNRRVHTRRSLHPTLFGTDRAPSNARNERDRG
jgi:hypothetical protein